MTSTVRALLAALLIAGAAVGGAYVVGLRGAAGAQAEPVFAALPAPETAAAATLAYRTLETSYYKDVSGQALVDGERKALAATLAHAHVKGALPVEAVAVLDPRSGDGAAAGKTLSDAEAYASALGAGGAETLKESALRGMLASIGDPYTTYLSQRENRELSESLTGGNFGGIGVYIEQLKDKRIVLLPIEGLPAYRAGMKQVEIVSAVDGTRVAGLSLDRIEQLIRGTVGTTVHLSTAPYKAPTKAHTFDIVRQTILVPTVRAKMENGIDYIRLSDFGSTSADEVRKALLEGRSKNARGYILDLRDNGGGLVNAAVDISSFFIRSGTIVSTISRDGDREDERAHGTVITGLSPLVVLVNKYTASASEITSGALQDYHLATLIGTKTFGKGVVQSIYPMRDGGALKITTQRYVTPAGRDIQHRGIVPDIIVDQDDDPSLIDTPKDKQLAAAKARLAQIAR